MEVCAYVRQAPNSSSSACVFNWALLIKHGKLKTAFHQYETACQNIGFLLCLEKFPRLPIGAQIAFRVTNTVKQRAV